MRPFPEDAAIAVVPEGSYAAGCSAPSHHHVPGRTSLGGRIAGSSARSTTLALAWGWRTRP
jgi:hypothetical protein